jgi:hypothetical protein
MNVQINKRQNHSLQKKIIIKEKKIAALIEKNDNGSGQTTTDIKIRNIKKNRTIIFFIYLNSLLMHHRKIIINNALPPFKSYIE